MANELYHYGRKGMKWYQHIFTNGDGIYKNRRKEDYKKYVTDVEAKKASLDAKIGSTKTKISEAYANGAKKDVIDKLTKELSSAESEREKLNADPNAQIRNADVTRKKAMLTASSSVAGGAKNAASEAFKMQKAVKGANTSDMSDDDLRKATERLNLEANYANAVSRKTDKAEAWVTGILGVAGSLFTVGASAVDLYNAMMTAGGVKYDAQGNYKTD